MSQNYLRKYGVQTTLHFVLYEVDGVDFRVDAADGGTDCTLMKDEGADTTCANDFVDEGIGYSIVVGATEMEFAEGQIYIVDSATKVWLDEVLKIETYGHASAMHAFDLDTATQDVNTTQISGTNQTANDNSADINEILTDTGTTLENRLIAIEADTDVIDDGTSGLVKIAQDVAATLVDTAVIGALGVGLTDLGGMSAGMKTEVNAEVDDVLSTDTQAMPGQENPSATPTLVKAIMFLYKRFRDKYTQTSTEGKLMADDATTVDQKCTVSDDGTTFTRGEWGTGP